MPPKYQVQSEPQGTENPVLRLQSQSWDFKQIFWQTSEYDIRLVAHLLGFSFRFVLPLLFFSLAVIGESKQGYSFRGSNGRSH